jgi:hypothetical protein
LNGPNLGQETQADKVLLVVNYFLKSLFFENTNSVTITIKVVDNIPSLLSNHLKNLSVLLN